ncbi:MAG: cytochrome C biosynthesis protein [Candidatus Brocadiia bacterium]
MCAMPQGGRWQRFESISNTIAKEEIDGYLVYRLIPPLYNNYSEMSICQRNLQDYDESVLLDNNDFGVSHCMNCHTFLNNKSDSMLLQVRGPNQGMLLERKGVLTKVDMRTKSNSAPGGFASWHPSGRVVAFSVNKVRQFFHHARTEVRDGIDMGSYLELFWVDTNTVTSNPKIAQPGQLETWPAWSSDGRYLYFCQAPRPWTDFDQVPPPNYDKVKYDLMRIGFDVETGAWGEVETVLSSKDTGLSISLPRFSPDGRFLVFCMSDYSTFPTFQPSSDLYLMDLKTGRYGRMECNSDQAESWHCWSSNSRWLVFTSKRGNGLFGRPYFSYIDENGKAQKPFILPQRNPAFYDSFAKLYQLPELIIEPVPVSEQEFARAILAPGALTSQLAVTSATPKAETGPTVPMYGPSGQTDAGGESGH